MLTANSYDKLLQYALFKSCTILRSDLNLCQNTFTFGNSCLCHISSSWCPASHFPNQLPHSPSQLNEANLFVDLFLVVLHHLPLFPQALLVLWVFLHFTSGACLLFGAGWQRWFLLVAFKQQRWKPFSSGEGWIVGVLFCWFLWKAKALEMTGNRKSQTRVTFSNLTLSCPSLWV